MPNPGSQDFEQKRHKIRRDMEEKGVRDDAAADIGDRAAVADGDDRVPGMPLEDQGREGQGS